jgi:uncharacterized membrane protein
MTMSARGQTSERPVRAIATDDRNVGRLERVASVIGGGTIAAYGLRRRDLGGLALAALGGSLLLRGATGHCAVYDRLGIDRVHARGEEPPSRAETLREARLVTVMAINRPAADLYAFWRHFENLPTFMSNLERVTVLDDRRSHWVAKAPFGASVEWDAEIVEDVPDRRIAWRSLSGADIANSGEVDFLRATGDRGTTVRVHIDYQPPGGRLALGLARMFGEAPDQRVREDVRRFKQLMETGEVISNAGPSCR